MSKGFNLLRVEYIFTVAVPILFCIFINDYNLIDNIEILAAFSFWAICGNTLNDLFDMDNPDDKETQERTAGFEKKEIGAISITAFFLGSALFLNPVLTRIEIGPYLFLIVVMVVLYCTVLKPFIILNWVLLGISHMWFPYFIIKIYAGDYFTIGPFMAWPKMEVYEYFLLACGSAVALSGNLIHEIVDGETITKYPLKKQRKIVWLTSIFSLGLVFTTLVLFLGEVWDYALYFAPLGLFPLGTMWMARSEESIQRKIGRTSLKDTGIIAGNLVFAAILIIIFVRQFG